MNSLVSLLDAHSGAVQAVATLALLGVTGVYVALTSKIARATSRQAFEAAFFNLLSQQRAIAENIKPYILPDAPRGRDALERAAGNIVGALSTAVTDASGTPLTDEALVALIDKFYNDQCQSSGRDFGYYFRSLYYLLDYIAHSELNERTKHHYADIVRSQLSTTELTLILYNCLSTLGARGFRRLATRFDLFMGMRPSHQFVQQHLELLHRLAPRAA